MKIETLKKLDSIKNRDFKAVEYMTASNKRLVLLQWIAFLKGGFQCKNFTKRLYEHLTLHCSFIAHYNRGGFYATYFENRHDLERFLSQWLTGTSVEYGWSVWLDGDYNDINTAMCDAAKALEEDIKHRLYEGDDQKSLFVG